MYLKKRLGQHLLVAEPTLEKIVKTLAPTKNDTVLEIGPGTGRLTKYLIRHAGHVIAVEKDYEMVKELNATFSISKNLTIVHADILEIDIESILETSNALFCGNLPYNISTPILFKLRDRRTFLKRGVITIQKEVATRLVAVPGSKDYGILSVLMQSVAHIKKMFDISPKSFIPPPKVTSSVVEIIFPSKPPHHIENQEFFTKVVKTAFSKRRKMIRNTIPKEWANLLHLAGIDSTRRPETITISEYISLACIVSGLKA